MRGSGFPIAPAMTAWLTGACSHPQPLPLRGGSHVHPFTYHPLHTAPGIMALSARTHRIPRSHCPHGGRAGYVAGGEEGFVRPGFPRTGVQSRVTDGSSRVTQAAKPAGQLSFAGFPAGRRLSGLTALFALVRQSTIPGRVFFPRTQRKRNRGKGIPCMHQVINGRLQGVTRGSLPALTTSTGSGEAAF